MEITVEISFYPLHQDFGHQVISFIHDLKEKPGIQLRTNAMSTQIMGSFGVVMPALTQVIEKNLHDGLKAALVLKIFNEGLELDWIDI